MPRLRGRRRRGGGASEGLTISASLLLVGLCSLCHIAGAFQLQQRPPTPSIEEISRAAAGGGWKQGGSAGWVVSSGSDRGFRR